MAAYRYYSVGRRTHDSDKIEILGWSRSYPGALAKPGTVAVYHASSREMAARKAKADRGFEIEWRKF